MDHRHYNSARMMSHEETGIPALADAGIKLASIGEADFHLWNDIWFAALPEATRDKAIRSLKIFQKLQSQGPEQALSTFAADDSDNDNFIGVNPERFEAAPAVIQEIVGLAGDYLPALITFSWVMSGIISNKAGRAFGYEAPKAYAEVNSWKVRNIDVYTDAQRHHFGVGEGHYADIWVAHGMQEELSQDTIALMKSAGRMRYLVTMLTNVVEWRI